MAATRDEPGEAIAAAAPAPPGNIRELPGPAIALTLTVADRSDDCVPMSGIFP
jgi:hypothetical protein